MESQVLIVGAGPTGMVLALWLSKLGTPFRIIEKNSGPGQASRAMAVQARTLEFYRQIGIAQHVIASGIKMDGLHLRDGTREIAGFQFGNFGSAISPFPFVLSFPQDDHEHLLAKHLRDAGVQIEWNTRLTAFTDEGHGVRATLQKGDAQETCQVASLCGCDGANSAVRQGLNLNFPGGTYQQMFYVTDVQASGPILNQQVNVCLAAGTICLAFPLRRSGSFRLLGTVPRDLNGRDNITFEDIRPYVKKQVDVDVSQVNWFSTYRVHHRVADHFRLGRVLIAGDAGHIHSPAGGQGMNTGIGDAVNLAWKLAAVVGGRADPGILDTYESERIGFARALVATTDRIFQTLVGRGLTSKLIRKVFFPYVAPLLLRFSAARRTQFRLVSQTRIRYPKSKLSEGTAGRIQGGDRLPWLNEQDNFNPLGSLDWQVHVYGACSEPLRLFAAARQLPVHAFEWDQAARSAGFARDAVYLIRPDGHIALAQTNQQTASLDRYLSAWKILPRQL